MSRLLTPTGAYRAWVTVVLAIASMAAAVGLTVAYSAQTRHRDDRRWCDLLSTLTTPQPAGPPATAQEERGRQVTAKIEQLSKEFGCPRR